MAKKCGCKGKGKTKRGKQLWQKEQVEQNQCLLKLASKEADMEMEESLRSKSLYKLLLIMLKYMPMIIKMVLSYGITLKKIS